MVLSLGCKEIGLLSSLWRSKKDLQTKRYRNKDSPLGRQPCGGMRGGEKSKG